MNSNSKSEYRNPKQIQNSNDQNLQLTVLNIWILKIDEIVKSPKSRHFRAAGSPELLD